MSATFELAREAGTTVALILAGLGALYVGVNRVPALCDLWNRFFSQTRAVGVAGGWNHHLRARIVQALSEGRVLAGADRISLFLFHNGRPNVLPTSPLNYHMSCIFELCGLGVSGDRDREQNLTVGNLPEAVDTLFQGDSSPVVIRVADLPPTAYRGFLQTEGITWFIKTSLRHQGRVVGFVVLDYLHPDPPPEHAVSELETTRQLIEGHMTSMGDHDQ